MRVLYFHTLRQVCGRDADEIADPPATAGALLDLLIARHPGLAPHGPTLLIARNHEFVGRSEPLDPADEVALMPPVSGG